MQGSSLVGIGEDYELAKEIDIRLGSAHDWSPPSASLPFWFVLQGRTSRYWITSSSHAPEPAGPLQGRMQQTPGVYFTHLELIWMDNQWLPSTSKGDCHVRNLASFCLERKSATQGGKAVSRCGETALSPSGRTSRKSFGSRFLQQYQEAGCTLLLWDRLTSRWRQILTFNRAAGQVSRKIECMKRTRIHDPRAYALIIMKDD